MNPHVKRGIILLSVILILASAGIYWKGANLVGIKAKESIENALKPIGIHEVEIGTVSLGWGRIYFRNIQSKESPSSPVLSIQELDIAFSPFFGIKAIDVTGASLDLKVTNQSSFFAEAPYEKLSSLGKLITHFKAMELPHIAIRNSSFIVPTHKGVLSLPVQMTTQTTDMKQQIMTLDFGEQGENNFSGQFILNIEPESLTLDVHTTNIDIETPQFQLKAPEISFVCHLLKGEEGEEQIKGFARLDRLKLHHYGTLLAPLEINLQGAGTPQKFTLDELTITEKKPTQKGESAPALLELEGSVEPDRPYAQAAIAFQIPSLARLWDFTPLFAKNGSDKVRVGGNFTGEGDLIFDKDHLTAPTFNIKFRDASFTQGSFAFEGASSRFDLKGLMPLATKGSQHISFKKISLIGVDLKDAHFTFLLDDEGRLQMKQFTAATLGGELKASRFRKNTPTSFQFEADFKGIELGEILKLTDISTLSGQAKLGGNALLQYSPEEGIDVIQARLDSLSESGTIQYKPEKGISDKSPPAQAEIEMAYNVLDNLHFTLFNIRLIRIPDIPGEMQGTIKILGSNPNVLNGYPFEFNIVTTGKLKDLVVNTLKTMNSPPDLSDKVATKQAKPLRKK